MTVVVVVEDVDSELDDSEVVVTDVVDSLSLPDSVEPVLLLEPLLLEPLEWLLDSPELDLPELDLVLDEWFVDSWLEPVPDSRLELRLDSWLEPVPDS